MYLLTPDQLAALRAWFLPDRPGPLVGLHVIQTGHGAAFAGRWPDLRAVLVDAAGNYELVGEPAALAPGDLAGRLAGFVAAADRFEPLLRAAFPALVVWERVILARTAPRPVATPDGVTLRGSRRPMPATCGA